MADADLLQGRKTFVETNVAGDVTQLLFQPNEKHGAFELKQVDKSGRVTQWYQYFVDADGKVLLKVTRSTSGYESVERMRYNLYRDDGNISGFYEFTGDGRLLQRVKYSYDEKGNWITGIIYDRDGKVAGEERSPPQTYLYGAKSTK